MQSRDHCKRYPVQFFFYVPAIYRVHLIVNSIRQTHCSPSDVDGEHTVTGYTGSSIENHTATSLLKVASIVDTSHAAKQSDVRTGTT